MPRGFHRGVLENTNSHVSQAGIERTNLLFREDIDY